MHRARFFLFVGLFAFVLTGCKRRHVTAEKPHAALPTGHGQLYVSNEVSGDVTVIDLTSNTVVATIPVGKRPRGIQRSPDGAHVYVALSGSPIAGPGAKGPPGPADKSADGIGVIDTLTQKLVDRLPSGSDPEQFSLSKDGARLFISNEDVGTMITVDTATRAPLGSVPVGGEPEGVATSPDGKWVYVTSEEAGTVTVVDAASGAKVTEMKVGARPRNIGFLPDGSKAYVPSENESSISVVALPAHRVVKTIKLTGDNVRPMGVAIAPDGGSAYVTTGHGGTVAVIDTRKDEPIEQIQVGKRPWGIVVSGDGKVLYVANGLSDDVSVVDTASRKEVGRITVGKKPWGLVLVP